MAIKKIITVFDGATTTATSAAIATEGTTTVYFQVEGTFTAFEAEVHGKVSTDCSDMVCVAVYDMTTGSASATIDITDTAIVKVDISGFETIEVEIKTLTGTDATVVAKFVD